MMQRPVITGDSVTVRQELIHKQHVYLVERANAGALAAGILELAQNPALCQEMAANAFARVQENTITAIGQKMKAALLQALPDSRQREVAPE